MNDLICPISFINEKQAKSTDLNELFIAGYRDKVCNDFSHSMTLDEIKSTFDFENLTPDQSAWLTDMHRYEYNAFNDSIISYLINNITDLTVNTLILFMQKLSMPNGMIDINIDQIINELDIRNIVTNAIADIFEDGFIRGEIPEQTFLLLDMRMNSLYSIIVTKVFDAYIDKFMAITVRCSGIENLFQTLYAVTYNSTEYPKDQSYSNMYVFCSSIMREAIDSETLNYRIGLKGIAQTATAMIIQTPNYTSHLFDPNYLTDIQDYQKCSLFGPVNNDENMKLGVCDE